MAEEKKIKTITYRTHNNANFTGFTHPETRRLISVDEKGEIQVKETDTKAIAILDSAKDVFKI